jgi:intracellular sulfur oxidation DsrE/DsrF family protein
MKDFHAREYLNAFIDGELTHDERLEFLRQLEHDPELKAEACELRTLKEMVRGSYQEVKPRSHGQAGLRDRRVLRQAVAAGLLLVCGLIGGWLANERYHQPPGFERLAGLPDGYQPVVLTRQVDPDKLVLHVDSSDRAVFDRALGLAESLLAHNPQRRRVEIVVHSGGLDMLRADVTPYRDRINRLAQQHANLAFVACGNTIARYQREGKTVVLVPEAKPVSSAVGEIVNRMQQGWVYIKV